MKHDATMLPTRSEVKTRARTFRARRHAAGHPITHSQALERISQTLGHRDWNTLSARITALQKASCLTQGDRVAGRYMGHRFEAKVLKLGLAQDGSTRMVLRFERAVDAAHLTGVSAMRRQVHCRVDRYGRSAEHRSDGTPHVELAL